MKPSRLLGLFAVLFGMSACLGGGEGGVPAAAEQEGGFAPLAAWFGRDRDREEDPGGSAGSLAPELPRPRQLPVGSVHLVQPEAGFLLIASSRTLALEAGAELMTYDAGGRPTGRLKLSPERKSGFLAADIAEGSPQVGDRVLLFTVQGAGAAPALPEGSAVEVLE